jgi:hypothetical protein
MDIDIKFKVTVEPGPALAKQIDDLISLLKPDISALVAAEIANKLATGELAALIAKQTKITGSFGPAQPAHHI